MKDQNEDHAYEQWRQRRLDALDEEIAKDKADELLGRTKFGQGLKQVDWVQKYATKDPWPNVPWKQDEQEVPTLWGALIVMLVVVGGFMVGLLWEVL